MFARKVTHLQLAFLVPMALSACRTAGVTSNRNPHSDTPKASSTLVSDKTREQSESPQASSKVQAAAASGSSETQVAHAAVTSDIVLESETVTARSGDDTKAFQIEPIDTVALFQTETPPLVPVPDSGNEPRSRPFLTLADLQQLAIQNNPTMPLAGAEVEKERGLWQQAGLYPNPTVGYVNSSSSSNGQSQQNGVLVQQTFITAGKLEKARAVEAYGIQDAIWEQDAQRLRIINDVRLRYYDVLAAQEQIKIATELSELSQQALQAAQSLLKGMQVPRTDVLRAEVQYQKIQTARQNAQLEYEAAWNKLAVIVGCPQMKPVPLEEPAGALPDFDLETEWQRLLAESPQLKQVQSEIGIAHASWVSAEAAPVPDVTVQFVSQYDSIGSYGTFNSLIALPLPLFNRNQGGIYNTSQEYVRAHKEQERVVLVLRDQLVTTHGNYLLAKNQAERLRSDVLPKLKENLELTVNGYRVQEYSMLEVLNAQEAALESNLEYVASMSQARRLAVEIEGLQLTGGLNPASIGTAIQEVGTGGRLRAVKAQMESQNNAGLSNFAPAAMK